MTELHSHLLRGGSWVAVTGLCRSAYRLHARPDNACSIVGFRVVCHAQGEQALPLEETHD